MADPPAADAADAALLAQLRQQIGERVPDDVLAAARDALHWRDPNAALAVLVADSADASSATASVRGDEQPRLLSFASAELAIDVEASLEGDGTVSLMGQLAPVGPASVEVDHRHGVLATTADELGRFSLAGIEPGLVRVRCTRATGSRVHTAWVLLS
jgi:hypothetical protein